MSLYAPCGPVMAVEQIQEYSTMKSHKKHVEFATLFQLLVDGRPMMKFEGKCKLYEFLNVLQMPCKHWAYGSKWVMAEHLYDFVK